MDRPLLTVECEPAFLEKLPAQSRESLLAVLANDPRPRYQDDPERIYGMAFGGVNVKFRVEGEILTVVGIE